MKSDLTTTFLNCLLGVLVALSVVFGYVTISRGPKVPMYTEAALQDNNNMMMVNSLLNEAATYNATARNPELARIIQSVAQKPANH